MKIYKVRTKRELLECDEFLAQHGPLNGPPASTQQATWRAVADLSERSCRPRGTTAVACACTESCMDQVVVHLTNCAVAPDWRGRGLQESLLEARLAWAKRKGATLALTHTWTTNVGSMVNLIKAGFEPMTIEGEHITFRKAL